MNKLSIIIPAYNEENSVISVINNIRGVMKKITFPWEIVVVNDGSTDNTKKLLENEGGIILVNHPSRKGYGASLKSGVKKSEGDFVLFIDADGQQDPEDILKLIKYVDNYDMVVGARTNITSQVRTPAKKFLAWFGNYVAQYKIPDLNSGFRIIKKTVFENYLNLLPNSFSLSTTITLASLKDRLKVKYIPIKEMPRKSGESKINPVKDFFGFMVLILRLTILFSPLRVFFPISFFLFLVGAVYTTFSVIKFFYISEAGILLISSSIIIFFFGLLLNKIVYIRKK